MAISRKTQKDVGNYEAKLIGPFSTRQTVFVGIAAVLDLIIGSIMNSLGVSVSTIATVCVLLAAPFAACGYIHPYGMNMEDFLLECYIYRIKAPKKRLYKTETGLDKLEWDENNQSENEQDKNTNNENKKNKNKKTSKTNTPPTHRKDKQFPDFL